MALPPSQMGEAILRNLEPKTGHALAHWLDVLRASGAADARTGREVLEAAGLGHFQAVKVWEASRGDDPYGDPGALVDALFPDGPARAAYEAFAKTCLALGDGVVARPCRTYVPFYAARQFAVVKPGEAPGVLRVGVALAGTAPDDALAQAAGLAAASGLGAPVRIAHAFAVDGEPSAAQVSVLAEAYRQNAAS